MTGTRPQQPKTHGDGRTGPDIVTGTDETLGLLDVLLDSVTDPG
ncbi:hypothetical protein [Streptomyces sp. NPDC058613]